MDKQNVKIGNSLDRAELCFLNIKKHTENEVLLQEILDTDKCFFYSVHQTNDHNNTLINIFSKYRYNLGIKDAKISNFVLSILLLIFLFSSILISEVKILAIYFVVYWLVALWVYKSSKKFNFLSKKDSDSKFTKNDAKNLVNMINDYSDGFLVLTDIDYVSKKELNAIIGKALYLKKVAIELEHPIKICIVGTRKALLVEHLSFFDCEVRPYDLDSYIISVLESENVRLSKRDFSDFYARVVKEDVLPYEISKIAHEYEPIEIKKEVNKKRR